MTLLDRYLASVRSALPESQRDDIVSELSEDLRSQIEDREAELGRGHRIALQHPVPRLVGERPHNVVHCYGLPHAIPG